MGVEGASAAQRTPQLPVCATRSREPHRPGDSRPRPWHRHPPHRPARPRLPRPRPHGDRPARRRPIRPRPARRPSATWQRLRRDVEGPVSDHADPRPPTRDYDAGVGGRGRAPCGARRQAARRDAGLATPPTILTGNTRRVARPSGSRIRPDHCPGRRCRRKRAAIAERISRRAAPLRELPRHRECCEAPRTPGPWNSRAPGDRESSIHTSRRPGKHRRRPTRAVASSPPGHRYRLHRPPVGVPAPIVTRLAGAPARRPRPRYGALTRLLRPDPRRQACAACSPLGGVPPAQASTVAALSRFSGPTSGRSWGSFRAQARFDSCRRVWM